MTRDEIAALRDVSVSQGLMLETSAERLCERGGPHFGSPDKVPAVRLATIRAAGEAAVPFTSGILIGIGETRRERIEALLALRDLHRRHGHLQEIIIQNFRAKPGTRMAGHAGAARSTSMLWTIAVARILFGADMNIQAPPNLQPGRAAAADRGRHQRLGRRVAGHARSRQPGAAVARARRARARDRASRQGAGRAARGLSRISSQRADRWIAPALRAARAAHGRCRRLRPRRRPGRRAPTSLRRTLPAIGPAPRIADAAFCDRAAQRRGVERSRDRGAVRRARRELARGLRRGRCAARARSAAAG